ncbi:hypothetical protein GT93_00875 [Pseudomonas plecoglossicida]|nr:hypothetical protein GT93_00875 [Pseudomonas plecoglossicida]
MYCAHLFHVPERVRPRYHQFSFMRYTTLMRITRYGFILPFAGSDDVLAIISGSDAALNQGSSRAIPGTIGQLHRG